MDRSDLAERLAREFDGEDRQYRIVARQADDLAEAGRLAADMDVDLTAETVVSNIADAPEGYDVAERWNWWIDSLTLSHGGYDRFRVRSDVFENES